MRPPLASRLPALLLALLLTAAACQRGDEAATTAGAAAPFLRDTGGPLRPEQAAYDVRHYALDLRVWPGERRIAGTCTVRVRLLEPLDSLLLDLDPLLTVRDVAEIGSGAVLGFEHEAGLLRIDLGDRRPAGDELAVRIAYGGQPRVAPNPPWEGGFVWATTPSGAPWIATCCQMEGADLWWPCKDHPSDKPDEGVDLWFTVPPPLVVASNGRFLGVEDGPEGTRTWRWRVTTPIANYCVALNAAPYVEVEREYTSVTGERWPVTFWALPAHRHQAAAILPQFLEHLRWFEEKLGPYPFRADKYGIVETPHLGMEHQTIIAYGNRFRPDPWGFDWLHHHELAHEWFANLVTAPDWNDFWIHEGFATWMQKLYVEDLHGPEAYHRAMAEIRPAIRNTRPMAPREPRSSGQMYFADLSAPPGQRRADDDIYFKGAWVLHTLRWLLGDEAMDQLLRRLCYPDPALEQVTDGRQCHFATSEDVQHLAEEVSGRDLGWFFELYLRQPELPRLEATVRDGRLELRWRTPGDLPFPMPVEVEILGATARVEMPGGRASLALPPGAGGAFTVDPHDWILRSANHCLGR